MCKDLPSCRCAQAAFLTSCLFWRRKCVDEDLCRRCRAGDDQRHSRRTRNAVVRIVEPSDEEWLCGKAGVIRELANRRGTLFDSRPPMQRRRVAASFASTGRPTASAPRRG